MATRTDTAKIVNAWFSDPVTNFNELREALWGTTSNATVDGEVRTNSALKKRVEGMVIGPVVNLKDSNGKTVKPRIAALCEKGETEYHGNKNEKGGKVLITKRWVLKKPLGGSRTTSALSQDELFERFPNLAQWADK